MQEPSQKPWGLILGTVVVASLMGGGLAWMMSQPANQTPIVSDTETPQPTPTERTPTPTLTPSPDATSPATPQDDQAAVYWLKGNSPQTELVAKAITPSSTQPTEAQSLESAFNQLLAGSGDQTLATSIPQGTKLLNLALKADGVHVDLSSEFTAGGGSESMKSRLGQVLYTATSTQPNASVWISVNGKSLELLGGEGLVVDQPLTRNVFEKEY